LLLLALSGIASRAWSQSPQSPSSLPLSPTDPAIPAQPASAQQPTDQSQPGSIGGTVLDQDGAVLQGATVTLTFTGSAPTSAITATTDSTGGFIFPAVPSGNFKLTVSSKGFTTQTVFGILHPGEVYQVQAIVLPLSTAASEVTVTATQTEIAQAQIQEEETQRILGVIPNFYVSYAANAAPLDTKQKYELAWKTSIDPVSFLAAGFFAGIEQAENTFKDYGQGAGGYAKRFAANYADNFIGTMIGSAILPAVFKQDPRYFYKGTGSIPSRALYAIEMSLICKGDNGHWQLNYSAIIGGLGAAGISNIYYPASDREGATLTFENALIGMAEGAVQNLVQEFIIRRLTPKLPSVGASKIQDQN
jgi:Carboxypeptidase regulatory-like domain